MEFTRNILVPYLSRPIRPKLLCNVSHQPQLRKHLLLRHALGTNSHAGKAALRANADVLHDLLDAALLTVCNDPCGFQDAPLDLLRILEGRVLGGHNAEDDVLALGQEAQGLEAAGPLIVVLEEEGVVVEDLEETLGNLFIRSLAEMKRL